MLKHCDPTIIRTEHWGPIRLFRRVLHVIIITRFRNIVNDKNAFPAYLTFDQIAVLLELERLQAGPAGEFQAGQAGRVMVENSAK
jgi:hypothetical protein